MSSNNGGRINYSGGTVGGVDETRWLTSREEGAWRALQFMQMRLEGALARQLASDSDLSYPDYLVLVALTDRPDGRMRLFELAEVLGWEKSRLSHHVARRSMPTPMAEAANS
jgi:hypothetical protein